MFMGSGCVWGTLHGWRAETQDTDTPETLTRQESTKASMCRQPRDWEEKSGGWQGADPSGELGELGCDFFGGTERDGEVEEGAAPQQ